MGARSSEQSVAADWRATAVRVAVRVNVAVLVLVSPLILLALGWFLEEYEEGEGAAVVSHRVHEVSFGVLFALMLVGALSQLREPRKNTSGMWQLIVATTVFAVVITATGSRFEWFTLVYVLPVVGAAVFHPAGRQLWRPQLRVWPIGLILAITATNVLWAEWGAREVELGFAEAQDHTTHWGGMAALFIAMALLSWLTALRLPGYQITAWTLTGAAVLYGAASLLYPFDASAHPSGAAIFTIAWGLAWPAAIAYEERRKSRGRADKTTTLPTFLLVAGLILLIPGLVGVLLGEAFAILVLIIGGGLVVTGVVLARRREATAKSLRRSAKWLGVLVVIIVISGFWNGGDDPPNVPHALDVEFNEATAATCTECHSISAGREMGHSVTRTCGFDGDCYAGRTDCLGCHAYNPSLGGTTVKQPPPGLALIEALASWHAAPSAGLTHKEIDELKSLATSGATPPW